MYQGLFAGLPVSDYPRGVAWCEAVFDETYGNGVRKATFHDPDGNEVGFGMMPDAS